MIWQSKKIVCRLFERMAGIGNKFLIKRFSILFASVLLIICFVLKIQLIIGEGPPSKLGFVQQPSGTAIAGVNFSQQPQVAVQDNLGNTITTDNLTKITLSRGATGTDVLQGTTLTQQVSGGVATFSGLSYNKAETMNLLATVGAYGKLLTSDADFSGGTLTQTAVSGTGSAAKVQLLGNQPNPPWTTMSNVPATPTYGASLVNSPSGDYLYAFVGNNTSAFYRYSVSANTWTAMADAPAGIWYGGSLVYPGAGDFIYAYRGNGNATFYRYSISGNTWATMADAPAGIWNGNNLLVYPGSGDYIYGAKGGAGGPAPFYRYSITGNTWVTMAPSPRGLSDGNGLAYPGSGDYIYAYVVGAGVPLSRYSISANTWDGVAIPPNYSGNGGGLVYPGSGDYIYGLRGNNTTDHYRYSISGNTWTTKTATPESLSTGGSWVYPGTGDYIYGFRGNSTATFYRYQISADTGWTTMASTPGAVWYGASLAYPSSGDYIYALRGYGTTSYYRYSISGNTWTTMASTPGNIGFGDHLLAYPGSGDYIYALAGGISAFYYRYSLSGNTWTTMASTPGSIGYGGSLAYPASGDYIYALAGNNTTTYYRYSISGNTWTTMASTPGSIYLGGSLAYPASGDYMYALAGGNPGTTTYYRYSISANTWTTMASTPGAIGEGGSLAYPGLGDYIYALQGNNTGYYRYSISANTWTTMAATPGLVYAGGSLAYPGSGDYMYALAGNSTTDFWRFHVFSYPPSGTYESASINQGALASYLNLNFSKTTPANTTLTVDIRAGNVDPPDGTWTTWKTNILSASDISGLGLNSNQYFRFRLNLSSTDTSTTPSLDDLTFWYSGGSPTYTDATSSNVVVGAAPVNSYVVTNTTPQTAGTGWSETVTGKDIYNNTVANDSTTVVTMTSSGAATFYTSATYATPTTTYTLTNGQATIYVKDNTAQTITLTATSAGPKTGTSGSIVVNPGPVNSYVVTNTTPQAAGTGWSETVTGKDANNNTVTNDSTTVVTMTNSGAATFYTSATYATPTTTYTLTNGQATIYVKDNTAQTITLTATSAGNKTGTSGSIVVNPGPVNSYVVTNTTPQTAGVGWSETVTGKDIFNNTVTTDSSTVVTMTNSGAATFYTDGTYGTSTTTYTLSSGTKTIYVKDTTAQTITLTATSSGPKTGTSANIVVNPGAIASYTVTTTPSQTAGTGWTETITAKDTYGNTVSTDSSTVFTLTNSGAATSYIDNSYSAGTYTWTETSDTDFNAGTLSSALVSGTGNAASVSLARNPPAPPWTTMASTPGTIGAGGSLAYPGSGDYIYALQGNGQTGYYRFSISANTWTTMASTPSGIYGGSLSYPGAGDYMYALRGNWSTDYYRYSISANTWTIMSSTPGSNSTGSSLAYPGSGDYIYALQGNNTIGYYRYSISSNTWTTMASTPGTIGAGGSLAYPGSGDYIYALQGNSTSNYYRYSISGNTWVTMASTPSAIESGASLSYPGSGDYIYTPAGSNYYRYSISGNTWATKAPPPGSIAGGGSLAYPGSGDYMYALAGQNTIFYRYQISIDAGWASVADIPGAVEGGGSLAYPGSGDYIYALRGLGTTSYYRYSISGNTWASRAATPGTVYYGASLAYPGSGDYIYALAGNITTTFYRYSISGNTWATMAATPGSIGSGGGLAYPGSGDYIYALGGNYTTDYYRYSISGNTWTTMASTPGGIYNGGRLAYPGSGDYIYALQGNSTSNYYRYSISGNTWTTMAAAPWPIYGGSLAYPGAGDYMYALRGNWSTDYYRYSISANTWTIMSSTPGSNSTGSSLAYPGSGDYMYALRGNNTTNFYRYRVFAYVPSGTFTSAAKDLLSASNFKLISWNASAPANTTLKFQLAANNDNLTWNFKGPDGTGSTYYTNLAGHLIDSGLNGNRFAKYKAFLSTTDGSVAPILNDITVTDNSQLSTFTLTNGQATVYVKDNTAQTLTLTATDSNGKTGSSGSITTSPAAPAKLGFTVQPSSTATAGVNFAQQPQLAVQDTYGNTITTDNLTKITLARGSQGTASLQGSPLTLQVTNGVVTFAGLSYNTAELMNILASVNTYGKLHTTDADFSGGTLSNTAVSGTGSAAKVELAKNQPNPPWTTMAAAPGGVSWGSLAYPSSGDYVYALRGSGTTNFYRYSLTSNTWTSMASTPLGISGGGSLAYPGSGDYIYALRGSDTTTFYRYSISGNTWTSMEATLGNIGAGGALVYPGSGDYMYALRGWSGFRTPDFYRYSISGNTWTSMAITPGDIWSGGALVSPGTGDYIYAFRGSGFPDYYRYSISGNTWTIMANLPVGQNSGALVYPGSGDYIYALEGTQQTGYWRYSISGNTWVSRTGTLAAVETGALVYPGSGDYIFAFRGFSTTTFYRYQISADTGWSSMAAAPGIVHRGGALVYPGSGDFIYAFQGTSSCCGNPTFWRYSLSGNTWTTRANTPSAIWDGGSLVYPGSGDYIYALRGNSSTDYYRYSISGNTWTTMAATPSTIGNGARLAYPGSGDYIYALRAWSTTNFYRYSLTSNTWTTMASTPASISNAPSLTYPGSGDYMYALRGEWGTTTFYRYSISANTWTTMANTPGDTYYGASLVYPGVGDYMYAFRGAPQGTRSKDYYRYSISGNAWVTMAATPGAPYGGASLVYPGSGDYIYAFRGDDTTDFYRYHVFSYPPSGTYTSATIDQGAAANYSTLSFNKTTPANTTLTIDVRAGNTATPDGTWTAWQTNVLNGGDLSSLTGKRYFQYLGNFSTTDTTVKPSLDDISFTYTGGTTSYASATSNNVNVGPAGIDHFTVTGIPNPATAGTANASVVVTAYDVFNNIKTDYAGTIAFSSNDPLAVLPSNYTFIPASDNGAHTFSVTLKTSGTRSVTVTGDTKTGQQAVTVNPAVIDHFTVTGIPNPAQAGTANASVVVTAFDQYNNIKTDYAGTIAFSSNDPLAVLPSNYTFIPASDNGAHTFSVTLKTSGTRSVTVTGDTKTGQQAVTVNPDVTAAYFLNNQTGNIAAGTTLALYTLTRKDQFSNPADSGSEIVDLASSSTGLNKKFKDQVSGQPGADITSIGISAGNSSVNFYYGDDLMGTYTITASRTGITSGTDTINVTHGAPDHLRFSGSVTTPHKVGVAFSLPAIEAVDAWGNILNNAYSATPYSGAKTITYTLSGQANAPNGIQIDSWPTAVTFANGVSTTTPLNTTLYRAQTTTITASSKVSQGGELPNSPTTPDIVSNAVVINPEAVDHLDFNTQQPSPTGVINVALSTQPIVAIRDVYNNASQDLNGDGTSDAFNILLQDSIFNSSYSDGPGTLTVTANPIAASGGLAAFAGLRYSEPGTIYLYASSPGNPGITAAFSNSIVLAVSATSTVELAAVPLSTFTITPTNDTEAEKFAVLKFKVKDAGGDTLSTLIDRISIAVGGTGANASTDIAWAELTDGLTTIAQATGANITNASIVFGSAPNNNSVAGLVSVNDNTEKEFTVNIYMKPSKLTAVEGQTYTFDVDETKVATDTGYSSLMTSDTGKIAPTTGTINVAVSHIEILTATDLTSASMTAGSNISIKLNATDANRNLDAGYSGAHDLIFSGLNVIGANYPKVGPVYATATRFGNLRSVNFSAGTVADTLWAVKKETGVVTAAESGQSYLAHGLTVDVSASGATAIALSSGNSQSGAVNGPLALPFVALVTDVYGNPKQGEPVTFAIDTFPGGATGQSLSVGLTTTDSLGQALSTLTLGNTAGTYTATATSAGLSGSPVTFTSTALAPTAMNIFSGNNQTDKKVIQNSAPLVVEVVAGASKVPNVTVNFAILSAPTGATGQILSASSAVTNASGQASTILTLGNKIGTYTVRATYGTFTQDFTVIAQPEVPYKVVLTGPSSVKAGDMSTVFNLAIQDQYNNNSPVTTGTVLSLSSAPSATGGFYYDAAGLSPITGNQITINSGSSNSNLYFKDDVTGSLTIAAAFVSGQAGLVVTSASQPFTVIPADIDHFRITGSTAAMDAGGSRAVTVTAYDLKNNVKTDYQGNISIIFSGANPSPAPTAQAPTFNDIPFGTATLLDFTSGVSSGTVKLYKAENALIKATAGVTTTSDAQALAIPVKHLSVDHLKFGANLPSPQTAGTAFNFETSIDAVDIYNNICDGANGAPVYNAASKTITYTLSGASDGPESGTDALTNPVAFVNGRTSTVLSATLYRAQNTTITPSTVGINGTNVVSNTITVNPKPVDHLRFSQQPSITGITTQALSTQPIVAVVDQYGNPVTSAVAQITLRASLTTGSYTPVTNGVLSAAALVKNITNGQAAFSGLKYSYPEDIYLEAQAASAYSLTPIYSFKISFGTAQETTIAKVAQPGTISSLATSAATAGPALGFTITDGGTDGFETKPKQIVINNTNAATTSLWTNFISGATLTDGVTEIQAFSISNNKITFGSGSSVLYSIADGTQKTFTLKLILKSPLPAGADNEPLDLSLDVTTGDITLDAIGSKFSASAAAVTDTAAIIVQATNFKITSATSMLTAGQSAQVTLKSVDVNGNIDENYTGDHSLVFSGASASPKANKATATVASTVEFSDTYGASTPLIVVPFAGGVNSSVVSITPYKSEIAMIKAYEPSGPYGAAIGTSVANSLQWVVNGGSADQLFWMTAPKTVAVANAPWNEFVISITDAYGNTAPSTVNVTVNISGGALGVAGTNTVAAVSGEAHFTNFTATAATYPAAVFITGTAPGISVNTGAFGPVVLDEKYDVTLDIRDSVTNAALPQVVPQILSGSTVVYAPGVGNSPFTLQLPYGNYTVSLDKDKYVQTNKDITAGVSADALDGAFDNKITWVIYMTSLEEATADYQVKNTFVYDETLDKLTARLWLERRGKLIVNSVDSINKLGNATIQIYDELTGTWMSVLTIPRPAFTDYTTGVYRLDVTNVTQAGGLIVLETGKTYFARCTISYGGTDGTAKIYETGTTFTITVAQSLVAVSNQIAGVTTQIQGVTQDIAGMTATISGMTTQISGLSTQISTDVSGVKTTVAQEAATTRTAVAGVKTDTQKVLTATETTIPQQITTQTGQITTQLTTIQKSAILNTETSIMQGETLVIHYRTYPNVSPTITVYDPTSVIRIASAPMIEYSPGLYEHAVTFAAGWPLGQYSIVCSEATYGTLDAISINVITTNIEEVSSNVSAVLGSVSPVRDIKSTVDAFSAAFDVVEANIRKAAEALAGVKAGTEEATAAAENITSLFSTLKEMSKKIHELGGTLGYDLERLYEVSEAKSRDINYIRNKTQELKSLMLLNQQLIENAAKEEPVVQTWFEFR